MAHPPLEIEKLPRSSPSPMTSTPAFFGTSNFLGHPVCPKSITSIDKPYLHRTTGRKKRTQTNIF